MVWANGEKNSGLVSFGIVFTICTNHFPVPKSGRVKDGFKQMVHKFPLGTFRPENRTALSDVPFAFQPDFPETFLLMVNNLKITFMEDDKRQFLQCDQFFPLHVVYCLFFIHFTVYYNWAKNFICFNGDFRYDIGIQ